ncbi:MAG: hypothetical protein K6T78_11845 [Alicyclobacillus sp.]|nr:hypothetical protein [Alicyclobacillus sp.]
MALNKLPTVKPPKPVLFGMAVFLGTFYFWFTKAQAATPSRTRPREPEI